MSETPSDRLEPNPLRATSAIEVLTGVRVWAVQEALWLRDLERESGVHGFHEAADYIRVLSEALDELEQIATRGCGQPNGECLCRCHLGVNDD